MGNGLGGQYGLYYSNPPLTLDFFGIQDPYPSTLQMYAQAIDTPAGKKYVGLPVVKWKWGMLTQAEYGSLTAFVAAGSRNVYISTRVNSGVSPSYVNFSAIMHMPEKGSFMPGGLWKDVEIEFTNLVNAAEIPIEGLTFEVY